MSAIINGSSPSVTFSDGTTQATSAIVSGKVPYANLPAGSVLQVVNAFYNTEVSTTSTSDSDTGLTATITPKYSTSKILVLISQKIFANNTAANNGGATIKVLRNSTNLITAPRVGLSDGTGAMDNYFSTSYLDSPASTSALTYKTTQALYGGGGGTVFAQLSSAPSGITLLEIAG